MAFPSVSSARGSSGGSGVPSGGTTGQILKKNSNTNGDAGWTDGAALSNGTPLAPASVGAAGTATDAARSDHVHPVGAGGVGLLGVPVGMYLRTMGGQAGNTFTMDEATLYAAPLVIPAQMTIDQIRLHVTTAGSAGALLRAGLYTHDTAAGVPGALIVDGGTVAAASTGAKDFTINQTLTTSVWLVAVCQGGAVTKPTLIMFTPIGIGPAGTDLQYNAFGSIVHPTTVNGALPSTWTAAGTAGLNYVLGAAVHRSA